MLVADRTVYGYQLGNGGLTAFSLYSDLDTGGLLFPSKTTANPAASWLNYGSYCRLGEC
jgi:hypothetical protein